MSGSGRGSGGEPLGTRGEAAAERALARKGLRILERRFRSRAGEIDLVAEDGHVLVFVEVKARRAMGFGRPAEAVDARKRARIARAALAYLQIRGELDRICRFDVVEVLEPADAPPRVRHIPDAFRLWPTG